MKLFISYNNSKFIKNVLNNDVEGLEILSSPYSGYLYKLQQQYHINSYIFSLEDLNQEVLQFISEYSHRLKIFIYHYQTNISLIQKLSHCQHLVHDTHDLSNAINIPNLVNTNIFYNQHISNRSNNSLICFIDNNNECYNRLYNYLYPNKKYKIKIYGSVFKNPQNIGYVSEQDKADLLNKNINYLSLDDDYTQEALICDCNIYTLDSLDNNQAINHTLASKYETYSSFITKILI